MSSYSSLLPSAARTALSSCRSPLRGKPIAPFLSLQQVRGAKSNPQAKKKGKAAKKDKKGAREYAQKDLKDMEQFTLCDAMRYIHYLLFFPYVTVRLNSNAFLLDISAHSKSAVNLPFPNTRSISV